MIKRYFTIQTSVILGLSNYICNMDYALELRFQKLQAKLSKQFEMKVDVPTTLFLIGMDLLGMGYKKFTKNEKLDLMHIAVCTVLEPYGYYEFAGKDEDNWPHFKLLKELPNLTHQEQQHLMKEAILEYFIKDGYITKEETLEN